MVKDLLSPYWMQIKLIGWGLLLAGLVGSHIFAYHKGKEEVRQENAEAVAKYTQTKRTIEQELAELTTGLEQERAERRRLQERYNDATNATPADPSCDLSDEQHGLLTELVRQGRR